MHALCNTLMIVRVVSSSIWRCLICRRSQDVQLVVTAAMLSTLRFAAHRWILPKDVRLENGSLFARLARPKTIGRESRSDFSSLSWILDALFKSLCG